jgi:hypothetical protein
VAAQAAVAPSSRWTSMSPGSPAWIANGGPPEVTSKYYLLSLYQELLAQWLHGTINIETGAISIQVVLIRLQTIVAHCYNSPRCFPVAPTHISLPTQHNQHPRLRSLRRRLPARRGNQCLYFGSR